MLNSYPRDGIFYNPYLATSLSCHTWQVFNGARKNPKEKEEQKKKNKYQAYNSNTIEMQTRERKKSKKSLLLYLYHVVGSNTNLIISGN